MQLLFVHRDLPDGMINQIELSLGTPLVKPSEFVAHLQILPLSLSDTFLDHINEDEGTLLGILGLNPDAIKLFAHCTVYVNFLSILINEQLPYVNLHG